MTKLKYHPNRGRLAGLMFLALVLLASCSAPTRLKVLNFFFDGVPGTESARAQQAGGGRSGLIPPPATGTPKPGIVAIVSTHKPVAERQCRMCHESSSGFYEPIAVNEKLCDRCHKEQRESQGWDHGPINLGTCLPCHRAHESQYPHLLDKPMPEVCLICHDEDVQRTPKYHQVDNLKECTACHDPHKTGSLRQEGLKVASEDRNTTGAVVNDQMTSGSRSQQ